MKEWAECLCVLFATGDSYAACGLSSVSVNLYASVCLIGESYCIEANMFPANKQIPVLYGI